MYQESRNRGHQVEKVMDTLNNIGFVVTRSDNELRQNTATDCDYGIRGPVGNNRRDRQYRYG